MSPLSHTQSVDLKPWDLEETIGETVAICMTLLPQALSVAMDIGNSIW
jgi:hypothetical protein